MSTAYDRFGIHVPDDTDSPNAPAQFRTAVDDITARLGYAGAQGGKLIVPATQAITSTSYALAGTPDRVQGLIVPNDGDLIVVRFSALAKRSAIGGGPTLTAAIFLTISAVDTQLKTANPAGAPVVQEVACPDTDYGWVYSSQSAGGLAATAASAGDATDVATGMTLPGGWFQIERLAAGTYDVSVRWKRSLDDGSIKLRRLEVFTHEFPTNGV